MRLPIVFACLLFSTSLIAADVSTIAGQPGIAGYWDGPAGDALFTHPTWIDVGVDVPGQYSCEAGAAAIYVVDRINQQVRRIDPDGTVTTLHVFTRNPIQLPAVN